VITRNTKHVKRFCIHGLATDVDGSETFLKTFYFTSNHRLRRVGLKLHHKTNGRAYRTHGFNEIWS